MSWFCAYQDCQHLDAFWQSAAGETVCLMVYWGSKELQSTLHTVLGRPIVRCKVGLLLEFTWLPRRHSTLPLPLFLPNKCEMLDLFGSLPAAVRRQDIYAPYSI